MSRRARRMMDELDELVNGPLSILEQIDRLEERCRRQKRISDILFPIIVAWNGIAIGNAITRAIAWWTGQ